MTRPQAPKRVVRKTLLVVCEGDAEYEFVKHVKALYGAEVGRNVTIKNAHGKGARNVLNQAIRVLRNLPYDRTAIVIDTDVSWEDSDRAVAIRKKIAVLESTPCFEVTLLGILGIQVEGSTADLKRAFREQMACEAHEVRLEQCFTQVGVDAARERVPHLHELMNHMGISKVRAGAVAGL